MYPILKGTINNLMLRLFRMLNNYIYSFIADVMKYENKPTCQRIVYLFRYFRLKVTQLLINYFFLFQMMWSSKYKVSQQAFFLFPCNREALEVYYNTSVKAGVQNSCGIRTFVYNFVALSLTILVHHQSGMTYLETTCLYAKNQMSSSTFYNI